MHELYNRRDAMLLHEDRREMYSFLHTHNIDDISPGFINLDRQLFFVIRTLMELFDEEQEG